MARSPDHPELTFVQARHYGTGRSLNMKPLWIVVHDMEAREASTTAEATAAYFARGADGRTVSSHYCVDSDSVIQCVRLKDTAWTVGNAPGNNRGINWELAGFARQTRAEWLDAFGLAMFHTMAPIVRKDAAAYGIPLVKLTSQQLLAGRPGVTSHNDLRVVFGGTTHTDPGPAFPWDIFLAIMTGEQQEANVPALLQIDGQREQWLSDGIRRRLVNNTTELATIKAVYGITTKVIPQPPQPGYTNDTWLTAIGGPVDSELGGSGGLPLPLSLTLTGSGTITAGS